MGFLLVKSDLTIIKNSANLQKWLPNSSIDLTGQLLTNVLPVLIGYEDNLSQLIQQPDISSQISIHQIHYYTDIKTLAYYNLQVESCSYAQAGLLVTITDVMVTSEVEQELQQKLNELRLQVKKREKTKLALQQELVSHQYTLVELQQELDAHQQTLVELRQAKEIAETSNRTKSTFLAKMSHELRTPLNVILGYAQILNRDNTLNEEQHNAISMMNRSGKYLLRLINDILDSSKVEAHRLKLTANTFYFSNFIQNINDLFQARVQEKNLVFQYQILGKSLPITLYADETRLQQILVNLLGNAIKFTEKGYINFIVSATKELNDTKNSCLIKTQYWKIRFQIEDSGIGIAVKELSKIFLPFQQSSFHNQYQQGTGLGLTITKRLVEMMDGKIEVESNLDQGTTFSVELILPEVIENKSIPHFDKHKIIHLKNKNCTILVVDDQVENRLLLVNLLVPLGFKVIEASNAQEAIKNAQQSKPNAILMDLIMPGIDGFETTQLIRQLPELKQTIIIAISAGSFKLSRQKSLYISCDDFIAKPIDINDILAKLTSYLNLEWEHREYKQPQLDSIPQEELVVAPPPEIAQEFYMLAMQGDIGGIIEKVRLLEKQDENLRPFLKKIQFLATKFKIRKIREFVKPYLD
ncbi:MAG: response regulator [Thiomargarita sp.]|nr:response regulator [Thiomargarita sp.]